MIGRVLNTASFGKEALMGSIASKKEGGPGVHGQCEYVRGGGESMCTDSDGEGQVTRESKTNTLFMWVV